jgi:hypothetical protein
VHEFLKKKIQEKQKSSQKLHGVTHRGMGEMGTHIMRESGLSV